MNRLTCSALAGAAMMAAALPAAAADTSQQYRTLPPGEVSCASWTRGREDAGRGNNVMLTQEGVNRAEREGWVHGYLSALNIEMLPADRGATRDLTAGIERADLMAQIDRYCADNPLGSLLGATNAVGSALVARWLAAHPPNAAVARAPVGAVPAAPAPRNDPVPPPANVAVAPAPRAVSEPPPPVSAPPLRPHPAPVAVAAAPAPPPQAPPPPLAPPPPRPAPVASAPVPPPPAAARVVASILGGTTLQLGAYRTHAAAEEAFQVLRSRYPTIIGSLRDDIQEVDLGERGIWHRLRIGPFADGDVATLTCNRLKAQGTDCFLVVP